ncbi:MAG TPA: hydroxyacid dehydrogenase [Candidatus Dormibacteraeota bacterium]|nr:hydroxyacid dehydrogenase [Candidatus Dormibacteraeota bacterium]
MSDLTNGARPTVVVLVPEPTRTEVLGTSFATSLGALADVRLAEGSPAGWDLPALIDGVDAAVTGWGTPSLTDSLRQSGGHPRLIAHTAGSIRQLLPVDEIGARFRVSHAAAVIADAVAEFVILEALADLRGLARLDAEMKRGVPWRSMREQRSSRLLGGRTVGVIGAGRVGRAVIRLLRAFGARVLVADPSLEPERIRALDVEPRDIPTLLAESDIVSLHAPVLPETRGMIGARELSLMRDGTLFINTARAVLVDEPALRAELRSGRIRAALDVFWAEPLPVDDELRSLPNIVLSPHSAGHSVDTWARQGEAMVEEVLRFLRGEPLEYEVTADMVALMA